MALVGTVCESAVPSWTADFDFDCNEMIFERASPPCYPVLGSPCLVNQERGGIMMA
jgi:hypothetical protein